MNKLRLRLATKGIDLKKEVNDYREALVMYAIEISGNDCKKAARYLNIRVASVYYILNKIMAKKSRSKFYWNTEDKINCIKQGDL